MADAAPVAVSRATVSIAIAVMVAAEIATDFESLDVIPT
jgi:hypothetical protein